MSERSDKQKDLDAAIFQLRQARKSADTFLKAFNKAHSEYHEAQELLATAHRRVYSMVDELAAPLVI